MRPDPWLILALLGSVVTTGCHRPPAVGQPAPATAPVVSVVKPEKRPVNRIIEQPGTVHAFEETVLYPKVPGYVRGLATDPDKADRLAHDRGIDIGSRVKKGQVLADLDVPELEEEFQQKEALVRQSEAEVVQAKKALAAADAGVHSAKAFVNEAKAGANRAEALYSRWQSEVSRVSRLVASGVIDTQTRDETQNQFKAAEASRAEALAKVASADAAVAKSVADREKAEADVTAAEAKLDVSRSDVRRIDAMRGYTRLKAPFDGIVTRRAVNTGDYVTADGKSGLFAVARFDPVRVVVNVPETDAGLVAVGQEVRIVLPALPGVPVVGKVIRTSWSLEPGSRTLRTEVDLPNLDAKLRPGMYVSARLTVEMSAEWSVPTAAIAKFNDEPVIYLVEDKKAVRVPVQLARGDVQIVQIRRYKLPGATNWTDVTGAEMIATPAAAITNGQPIP